MFWNVDSGRLVFGAFGRWLSNRTREDVAQEEFDD